MAKVPFLCPVCQGRGVVPQGFYSPYPTGLTTSTEPDKCRSCMDGIIWGDSHDEGVRVKTRMLDVDRELRADMMCPCCINIS